MGVGLAEGMWSSGSVERPVGRHLAIYQELRIRIRPLTDVDAKSRDVHPSKGALRGVPEPDAW